MRSLIFLLILVNLGYFAWNLTRSSDGLGRTPLVSRTATGPGTLARTAPPASAPPVMAVSPGGLNVAPKSESVKTETDQKPVPEGDCYTLGPFDSVAAADAVAQELKRYDVAYNRRSGQDRRPKEYWVYMPPQPSREKALEVSRKLSDQGIGDYYIVSTQEQRNAISLGLFDKPDMADSRSQILRKLGYETRIDVRYENYLSYWLDMGHDAVKKLQDAGLHSFLTEEQTKAVRHSCG